MAITAVGGVLTDKNKEVLDKLSKDQASNELKQKQQMGKEQFLHLITEQLKNQDPLAPMQDQQFISQMAQLQSLDSSNSLVELAKANYNLSADISTTLKAMNESIKSLVEKFPTTGAPKTDETTGLSTDAQTIVNELVKMNKAMEGYFNK